MKAPRVQAATPAGLTTERASAALARPGGHLLILVHHAFATGVKHPEGAQDGFLGVRPWEAEGAGERPRPGLQGPARRNPGCRGSPPLPRRGRKVFSHPKCPSGLRP